MIKLMRKPKNSTREQVAVSYMDSLSNWGRWGAKDELGTINLITNKKSAEAGALIKSGTLLSCARPIETSTRPDMAHGALRYMIDDGEGRDNILANKIHMRRGALEFIGMVFHGDAITHIDAPSHYFWKGKMYNDRPADTVSSRGGVGASDAEILNKGVFTRGILLDCGKSIGAVSVDDLIAAEKKAGVRASSGDALLIRGGKPLAFETTKWLYEREVAVIGSDTSNDYKHDEFAAMDSPFHTICLAAMGLWILDNCDLENLAKTCEKQNRREFAFFIAPLRLKNVTGSPVNPIAIF